MISELSLLLSSTLSTNFDCCCRGLRLTHTLLLNSRWRTLACFATRCCDNRQNERGCCISIHASSLKSTTFAIASSQDSSDHAAPSHVSRELVPACIGTQRSVSYNRTWLPRKAQALDQTHRPRGMPSLAATMAIRSQSELALFSSPPCQCTTRWNLLSSSSSRSQNSRASISTPSSSVPSVSYPTPWAFFSNSWRFFPVEGGGLLSHSSQSGGTVWLLDNRSYFGHGSISSFRAKRVNKLCAGRNG